ERPQLEGVRSNVAVDAPIFKPTDLDTHILRDYKISHLVPYINMQMLLGRHLGVQGKVSRLLAENDERTVSLKEKVDQFLIKAEAEELLEANGIYQFFPAQSDGNKILIYDPNDQKTVIETFTFPRQSEKPHLCLADYLRSVSSGEM